MIAVQKYQQALLAYAAAHRHLSALIESQRVVAKSFDGWEKLDPRGVNGSLERELPRLPSPESLREAVTSWKKACDAMHAAWGYVLGDDRVGLTAPENFSPEAWLAQAS